MTWSSTRAPAQEPRLMRSSGRCAEASSHANALLAGSGGRTKTRTRISRARTNHVGWVTPEVGPSRGSAVYSPAATVIGRSS
jgi:hypothetical protein